MKKYDVQTILRYIGRNKSQLDRIDVGIMEDWIDTNQRIFENDKLLIELPRSRDLTIRGTRGSTWGTPVMRVVLKNGMVNVLSCYKDDNRNLPSHKIMEITLDYKKRGVKMMGWDGVLR